MAKKMEKKAKVENLLEDFTTRERLNVLGVLPKEGDFLTLQIMRSLKEKLSLTEEENEAWQVKLLTAADGSSYYQWNDEGKDAVIQIELGKKARSIIVKALVDLEAGKRLPDYLFDLYIRFVDPDLEE